MGVAAPTMTEEDKKALIKQALINQQILLTTEWQWTRLANDLSGSDSPAYAVGTLYRFTLANTSGYIDKLRVWLRNLIVANASTTTAGALNRAGFYQLLGSLEVRLGNHIYKIPAGALALLYQTYRSRQDTPEYRGSMNEFGTAYGFAANLYTAPTSVAASGTSTYTGYIDIPLALLSMVGDPDGITPTLSNTGLQVEFTTPASLQGADCLINPFGTVGTLSVSSGGTISVYAHMAKQVSVTSNNALPPFVVGPAFVFEDVPVAFQQAETFYPFQGQQANLVLIKSIVVIDSPGELTGEYSDPSNLLEMNLMYDADTPVYFSRQGQNPWFNAAGTAGLANWMVDQGQVIGDQPPGVYVFDWGRGTNPNYPNRNKYLNLREFSRAGVQVQYNVAPQSGAQIHLCNVYLRAKFFESQA